MALETGNSLYWGTGIDNSGLKRGTKEAKGILAGFARQISALDVFAALSAGAALHAKKAIKEMTNLASRYETLGVVMRQVGYNAGYTSEQMEGFAKALEDTGISMLASRQTIVRMVQAQLDLTRATELARIAQDAAVIGNINSSEAFERMIYGIQSAQIEMLRTIGINVNFENAYSKAAKAVGRTTTSFTEAEKAQIRLNAVLESGAMIAGTYEAAMTTAQKQAKSLERHTEDLKVMLGQAFTPAFTEVIMGMTGAVTDFNSELEESDDIISDWGNKLRLGLIWVEAEIRRIAMLIDKVGGTMTTLGGIFAAGGAMMGIPGAQELADKMVEWNRGYEDRYNENMAALEVLAERYNQVQWDMSDTGKAVAEATQQAKEDEILARRKAAQAALEEADDVVEANDKIKRSYEERNKYKLAEMDAAIEREKRIANQYNDLPPEFTRDQDWQEQYAAEMQLIQERERSALSLSELKLLEQNTRRMTDSAFQQHIENIKAQIAAHEENYEKQTFWMEKLDEAMAQMHEREMQRIQDIGDAIQEVGDFLGQFNEDIREATQGISQAIDGFTRMQNATSGWGEFAGIMQVANAVDGWAKKLSEYLSEAKETTRGTDPMSLYWPGWDEFITAQKNYQISITSGEARIKRMRELIDYLERQLSDQWDSLAPIDRIRAEQDIQKQRDRMNQYVTGTTSDSIADAIMQGFRQGQSAIDIFATTFEDTMRRALQNTFEQQMIASLVAPFYDMFAAFSQDGLSPAEIDMLKSRYRNIVEGADNMRRSMEAVFPDLFDSNDSQASGMTGAIAGITEDTAGLLAGQFNAIRVDVSEIRTAMTGGRNMTAMLDRMDDLLDTSRQTAYNTAVLHNIYQHMRRSSRPGMETMRATGVQI